MKKSAKELNIFAANIRKAALRAKIGRAHV